MRKCINAFMTKRMVKWYPGMHISTFDYLNLTEKEQKNFVLEVEDVSQAAILDITTAMRNANDIDAGRSPDTDNTTNEFQGYDQGSSGGGGASGEY